WDLVCDRKSLTKTTGTIFFMGVMMGSVVFGLLCDKYGRRNTLLVSYIIATVFGFSSAFANSFVLFAVLRFFTGFGLTGIGITSIVLSIEWVDTDHRSFIGVIGSLAWSAGNMLLAGFAVLVTDWRKLIMTVSAPLGFAILTWWYGVASTYYGISLNISGFGLNMYLTHFIYAAIEVPAKLMIYCLLNMIGRRKCQVGTLLLTGICIAINIFIPK
ncbi:hypothetical protein INR49_007597, partial [Caranx melampygus]